MQTGRVMREKGIDELFAVVERLNGNGISCTLDVLGGYEENYRTRIERYEKAGWLRYHDYQRDVRPFIADSLYAAMRRFMDLGQAERREMGLAGRRHMKDVFDKRKVVAETLRGLPLSR